MFRPSFTHSIMPDLKSRLAALEAGVLPRPESWTWPTSEVLSPFHAEFVELELARYCSGREDVTDQVVKSLLFHTDRIIDYRNEWEEDEAIVQAARAFHNDWTERSGEIDELVYVFGDPGDALKHDRWDVTRGLLRSTGWQEMLRIRKLLESLAGLTRVIRKLGRARQTDEFDPYSYVQVQVLEKITTLAPKARQVRVPDMPAETRGVKRSGRIERMLAAEAVLLPHPKLRLVWFARHAERILMTYQDHDVVSETVLQESPAWRPTTVRKPDHRLEMGPMIICVDTSGSMRGPAEDVAKACVLEAMRTAHVQRRGCHAFAFSGPGEIVERELRVDAQGIGDAIDFLTQSFHGGTEVSEPLDRAVARVREEAWQFADLLIATDGEFGPTGDAVQRIQGARKELGLRVQGVLIGDRETIGMLETCDEIFWVRDWRRFGPGGECPVHSKSLTAEYFPGALRTAGTAATVPANEASRVISGRPLRAS